MLALSLRGNHVLKDRGLFLSIFLLFPLFRLELGICLETWVLNLKFFWKAIGAYALCDLVRCYMPYNMEILS